MKIHNFIGDFSLRIGRFKLEDRELFNQIRNVLRLEVGEKITLCDGKMNEGIAEIKEFTKNYIEVEIKKVSINQNEPERQVILYCSILKRENFELVVQKATEVGIRAIIPLITARTVKLDIRKDRLGKIIKEAVEQSGRGIVPALHDPISFEKVIAHPVRPGVNFFLDQAGKIFRLTRSKDELVRSTDRVGIFVGPEGGWTSKELVIAQTAGFEIVSLGKITLRAETAAIVGSYLAIHSI